MIEIKTGGHVTAPARPNFSALAEAGRPTNESAYSMQRSLHAPELRPLLLKADYLTRPLEAVARIIFICARHVKSFVTQQRIDNRCRRLQNRDHQVFRREK